MTVTIQDLKEQMDRIEGMLEKLFPADSQVANEAAIVRAQGIDLADYLRSKARQQSKPRRKPCLSNTVAASR